jgi:excisionase family DNA binding protein
MKSTEAAGRLEALRQRLEELGQAELAAEAAAIGASLRGRGAVAPRGGVMTTGEAAELLGVSSVNTIKRWAREGRLEGYQRGGRVMVSRASVERMLDAPAVAAERAYERELDEALAPFDAAERPLPPTRWSGRKPWGKGVGARP